MEILYAALKENIYKPLYREWPVKRLCCFRRGEAEYGTQLKANTQAVNKGASMNRRIKFCAFLVAVSLVFITATNSSAYVSGDVDRDEVVRLADALLVLRYIAGTQLIW